MPEQTAPVAILTDGTGVSAINVQKIIKDLVADFLLSAAAALVAVQVTTLDAAVETPSIVAFAIGGALIRSVYRAVLRWATT